MNQYVKLEDVIRTMDWFLIFVPSASLPVHAAELREMVCEAKALCVDALLQVCHVLTCLHSVENGKLILFGEL